MSEFYRCAHKSQTGEKMTVFHYGQQCTQDIFGEEKTCPLFVKGWTWLSCEPVNGALVMYMDGKIELVELDTISQEQKAKED